MAAPPVLVMVLVGVVFLLSGLIVNLIQAASVILIRPILKTLYRKINKAVVELHWLQFICLFDWWAAIKVDLYADQKTLDMMGKEHAIVISNHRCDIDWLLGWIMAQRAGCLGSSLGVMTKDAKFHPIVGWSMWFSEYVFLERSWNKDEDTLKASFRNLERYPVPFWLGLFVEGTRFNETKLEEAQEYAASRGLPVPRNVLIPRTKGFVSAVTHMRSFVPAIYNCTVAVPRTQPPPTFLRMFSGQPSVVKVQIKRHSMSGLPETPDGIAQWCRDTFVTKDALLEKYFEQDTFSDLQLQNIGRPIKSLIVVIIWSCLLGYIMLKLFFWFASFASWGVLCLPMFFLAIVVLVMRKLVRSSQSERSKPPKKTPKILKCKDFFRLKM